MCRKEVSIVEKCCLCLVSFVWGVRAVSHSSREIEHQKYLYYLLLFLKIAKYFEYFPFFQTNTLYLRNIKITQLFPIFLANFKCWVSQWEYFYKIWIGWWALSEDDNNMDNMKEGSCKCYSILLIGSIAVNTSTLQPTIANIVRSNTKCKRFKTWTIFRN